MTGKHKKSFTLLELIVAMGVFIVLLSMIAEIFVASQQLWSSSESRVSVYGSANVALDAMQRLITNSAKNYRADYGVTEENGGASESLLYIPMKVNAGNGGYGYIDLCTEELNMSLAPGSTSDTYFIRIYVSDVDDEAMGIKNGDLVVAAVGNVSSEAWEELFEVDKNPSLDGYLVMSGNDRVANFNPVISRVVSLQFTPLIENPTTKELEAVTNNDKMPIAVVIDMELMDPETFNMAAANRTDQRITAWDRTGNDLPEMFQIKYLQGIRKFSRIVYLGRQK